MDMYAILSKLAAVGQTQLNESKSAKPDFLDVDKDGNKKEPMKKALKDKKSEKQVEEQIIAEASVKLVMGKYQVIDGGKVVGTYTAKYEAQEHARDLNEKKKKTKKVEESEELDEKWDKETKVSPKEKGKYKGKSKAELQKQYNALKDKGPHKKGSAEYEKMKELQFAIRAKSGWGKVNEDEMEEGNEYTKARLDAIRSGKPTFTVGGKVHKVTGDTSDERQVDEADEMEVGKSRKTQHGKVTQVAPNVTRHTRNYDQDARDDDQDDDAPKAKGRPTGAGKKIGAKGPTGRSKLMREEGPGDDVQAAIELLMNNGYTVGKLGNTEEAPLDKKAVSKKQQRFMGMVHAAQKGEKPASKEVAKVAKTMGKKDAEDFAATKHKGLPEKKKAKKEESVEETTTSGSVATAPAEKKSKGGMSFGQGVYEAKLAESFEAHLSSVMGGANISIDDQGNMNVTVGSDGAAAGGMGGVDDYAPEVSAAPDMGSAPEQGLDDILKLSGLEPSSMTSDGYDEVCPGCGSADCSCGEIDETLANAPAPQYSDTDTMVNTLSGGLNGRKSTGQTTLPIINRDPARQGVGAMSETIVKETESRLWQLYKTLNEGRMAEVDQIFQDIANGDMDIYELYQAHAEDPVTKYAQDQLQNMYDDVAREHRLHPDDDFEDIIDLVAQQIEQDYGSDDSVPLH